MARARKTSIRTAPTEAVVSDSDAQRISDPATPTGRSVATTSVSHTHAAGAPPTIAKPAKKWTPSVSSKKSESKRQAASEPKAQRPKSKFQRKLKQTISSSDESSASEEVTASEDTESGDSSSTSESSDGGKPVAKTTQRLAPHAKRNTKSKRSAQKAKQENKQKKTSSQGKIGNPRKRNRIVSSEEESPSEAESSEDELYSSSDESDREEDEKPKQRRGRRPKPASVKPGETFVILKPSGRTPKTPSAQVAPGVELIPPTGMDDSQVAKTIVDDLCNFRTLLQRLDQGQYAATEETMPTQQADAIPIQPTSFPCLAPIVIALQCEDRHSLSVGDLLYLLHRFCPQCKEMPMDGCFDGNVERSFHLEDWFETRTKDDLERDALNGAWAKCAPQVSCDGNHKSIFDMMIITLGDDGTWPFSLHAEVSVVDSVPQVTGFLRMKRYFMHPNACQKSSRFLRFHFGIVLSYLNYDLSELDDQIGFDRGDDAVRDTEFYFQEKLNPRSTDVSVRAIVDTAATEVPDDLSELPTVTIPEGLSVTPKPHQVQNLAWLLEREQRGVKEYLRLTFDVTLRPDDGSCRLPLANREKHRIVVLWNPLTMQYTSFPQSTFTSDPELEDWLNPTIRGGLLCDEMGLGKTLSMTMLIKAHPAPDLIPQPTHEVRRDANGLTQVKFFDGARFSFKNDPAPSDGNALPAWASEVVQHLDSFQLEKLKATLIVVPVSLFGQWIDELRKMWGESPLTVLPFHGPERNKFDAEDFRKADVILTTYETLRNSYPSLEQRLKKVYRRGWEHRQRVLSTQDRSLMDEIIRGALMHGTAPFRNYIPTTLLRVVTAFFEVVPDSALARFQFHRVIWDECQKLTNQIPFVPADHQWLVSGTPIDARHEISGLAARLGITAYCTATNCLQGNSNTNIFQRPKNRFYGDLNCVREECRASKVTSNPKLTMKMTVLRLHLLLSLHDNKERSWHATGKRLQAAFRADPKVQVTPDPSELKRKYSTEKQKSIVETYENAMSEIFPQYRSSSLVSQLSLEDQIRETEARQEAERIRNLRFNYDILGLMLRGHDWTHHSLNAFPAFIFFDRHMIRHLKSNTARYIDIPQQTETVHRYQPSRGEERAYKFLLKRMLKEYRRLAHEGEKHFRCHRAGVLLGWINTLRRCAVHPELVSAMLAITDPSNEENRTYAITPLPPPEVLARIRSFQAEGARLAEAVQQMVVAICRSPPELPDCIVCYDQMQNPVMLPCHHIICRECLLALFGNQADARCPYCRSSLQGQKVQIMTQAHGSMGTDDPEWTQLVQRAGSGSKLAATMGILEQIWAADSQQKVVIFSSFTECLGQVAEALKANGVASFTIDGSTTLQKRSRLISDFQHPGSATKVCLITSRCGNAGLTLTAANHLLLLEPSLSAHVEQQAAARIHRFGQLKPVTIHRLVAAGTIEESIWQRHQGEGEGSILDAVEQAIVSSG